MPIKTSIGPSCTVTDKCMWTQVGVVLILHHGCYFMTKSISSQYLETIAYNVDLLLLCISLALQGSLQFARISNLGGEYILV